MCTSFCVKEEQVNVKIISSATGGLNLRSHLKPIAPVVRNQEYYRALKK